MQVGAQVVDPEPLGPRHTGAGDLLVEEEDVGLDPLRVEDAGRQPEHRVEVEVGEQLVSDHLAGAALEEDVVRQHHRGAAVRVKDGGDVLDEVELLGARRRHEVLPLDLPVLTDLSTIGADHGDRRLAAGGRVGQDNRPPLVGVGDQRVADLGQGVTVGGAHAVEEKVHRGESRCAVDELVAADESVPELLALGRHGRRADARVVVRHEEEPAGAAGGVDDRVGDGRADDVDDRLDQRASSEVLTRARAFIGRTLGQRVQPGEPVQQPVGGAGAVGPDQLNPAPPHGSPRWLNRSPPSPAVQTPTTRVG